MITLIDIETLEQKFHLARDALDEMTQQDYYPVYPQQISQFMGALSQPPWVQMDYAAIDCHAVLRCCETANLMELCCALTFVCRAERFCDGAWRNILSTGALEPVFKRLRQIMTA